jgi:hypothetical protein
MVTETERIAILLSLETEAFERKAKSSAAAISKLEARYDPLVAAAKRFEVEQAQLSRALEKGTIDQTKYASMLKLVTAGYDAQKTKITGATGAVANMNSAVTAQAGFLNRNSHIMQQAGYQVGDFAVQVQSGQSALVAFAQQGTQMAGAFGPLGAVLGAVLAVGLPLGAALYNMAGGSEEATVEAGDLDKAVSALVGSLDSYRSFTELAATSTKDLEEKFGSFAGEVKGFAEYMAGVKLDTALDDMKAAMVPLRDGLKGVSAELAGLAEAQVVVDGIAPGNPALVQARLNLELFRREAEAAAQELGINADQAAALSAAMEGVAGNSLAEMRNGAIDALAVMMDIRDTLGELPAPLRDANDALAEIKQKTTETIVATASYADLLQRASDLLMTAAENAGILEAAGPVAGWLSGAISDAQTLGAVLWETARAAAAARGGAMVNANPDNGPAFEGKGRSATSSASYVAPAPTLEEVITKYAPKNKSKGGGGGADKESNDLLKERDALLKSLQTPQQAYQDDIANIDKLQKAGLLTSEQYNLAIADVTANYDKARIAGNEWAQFIDGDLKDSFVDFALGADDAFGNIEQSIKKALVQLLLFNEGMFANKTSGGTGLLGGLFSGGSNGGILSGIFGGFRASGGPVSSSKSYVVGEEGPEMFTPSTSGTIIPNGATVAGGGGTSTIQISLGEGLVGSILTQAAGQSVQITSAASSAQQRSLKGAVSSAQARGTS